MLGLRVSEGWDHHHLTQLQSHGRRLAAEVGQVVLVAFADFFDDAMHPQAFEQAGDLRSRFVREIGAQLLVGETADEELTLEQGAK